MKTSLCLAACLLTVSAAFAADTPQFEVAARYLGFNPPPAEARPDAKPEPPGSDLLAAPRVTVKAGQQATIEVPHEVPVPGGTEDGKATVNSGVTLVVTPTMKNGKIIVTGRSLVRRRLESGPQPLDAVSFDTRETFFSGEATDGESLTIRTGDSPKDNAQVILTVTRVKQFRHVNHDTAPKFRVYAIEPSPEEAKKPLFRALGLDPAKAVDDGNKVTAEPPHQNDLTLRGIFQPADLTDPKVLQLKGALRELPSTEQPVTISSVLGEDGQTLDVKIQSLAKSAHPGSTELSMFWGSDILLTMADPVRPGVRRGLLIRQE